MQKTIPNEAHYLSEKRLGTYYTILSRIFLFSVIYDFFSDCTIYVHIFMEFSSNLTQSTVSSFNFHWILMGLHKT